MVKLILTGIWVVVVALAAVYFSIQMAKPPDPAAEEAAKKAVQEFVKGEMVTFPVLGQNKVEGYFLTRTSYIMDKSKVAEITLPIPELITDQLYTELVGDKVLRMEDKGGFDLKAFKERLIAAVNKRLGADVVLEVVVEQIDFISKDTIQKNMEEPGSSIETGEQIVHEKVPEGFEEDKSAAPAH